MSSWFHVLCMSNSVSCVSSSNVSQEALCIGSEDGNLANFALTTSSSKNLSVYEKEWRVSHNGFWVKLTLQLCIYLFTGAPAVADTVPTMWGHTGVVRRAQVCGVCVYRRQRQCKQVHLSPPCEGIYWMHCIHDRSSYVAVLFHIHEKEIVIRSTENRYFWEIRSSKLIIGHKWIGCNSKQTFAQDQDAPISSKCSFLFK